MSTSLLTIGMMILKANVFILRVKRWVEIFICFDLLFNEPLLDRKDWGHQMWFPGLSSVLYTFLSPVPASVFNCSAVHPLLVTFSTSSTRSFRTRFHGDPSSPCISHCTSTELYSFTHSSYFCQQRYFWKDGQLLQVLNSWSLLITLSLPCQPSNGLRIIIWEIVW